MNSEVGDARDKLLALHAGLNFLVLSGESLFAVKTEMMALHSVGNPLSDKDFIDAQDPTVPSAGAFYPDLEDPPNASEWVGTIRESKKCLASWWRNRESVDLALDDITRFQQQANFDLTLSTEYTPSQWTIALRKALAKLCSWIAATNPINPKMKGDLGVKRLIKSQMDEGWKEQLQDSCKAFTTDLVFAARELEAVKDLHCDGDKTKPSQTVRPKKSTASGAGRLKLIAALTQHHKYANGGCLNREPIGNNALARLAGVSVGLASRFFNKEFKGYKEYRQLSYDTAKLVGALKILNKEIRPFHLLYRDPPSASKHQDEGDDC